MLASCSERWFFFGASTNKEKENCVRAFFENLHKNVALHGFTGRKKVCFMCMSVCVYNSLFHSLLFVGGRKMKYIKHCISKIYFYCRLFVYILSHIFLFSAEFFFSVLPVNFFLFLFSPDSLQFCSVSVVLVDSRSSSLSFRKFAFPYICLLLAFFCNTCNLMQGTSTKIPPPQTTRWSSSKEDKINDNIIPLSSFNWNIPKLNCKC